MKTMMKKSGVFAALAAAALTAALVTAAALVIGCSEGPGNSNYKPPAGMGAVKLNFNQKIERATILPDNASLATFEVFQYAFTVVTPGVTSNPYVAYGDRGDPINLVPGVYSLVVIGYLDDNGLPTPPSRPAAIGRPTTGNITVSAGGFANIPITMYALIDPLDVTGDDGNFDWNIGIAGVTATTWVKSNMTVTQIGGGAVAGFNPRVLAPSNWVDNDDLPPGYYWVDFELETDKSGGPVYFRHILQIYENMTSRFTYTLTDDKLNVVVLSSDLDLRYVHPVDRPPQLTVVKAAAANGALSGAGTEASPYLLSFGGGASAVEADVITITVDPPIVAAPDGPITYTSVEGRFRNTAVAPVGNVFTLTGGTAPFDVANPGTGVYQFLVIGTASAPHYSGAPYQTEIFIRIVDETP
ncbi:MAG: hypothetical protein LBH20_04975 [Treponema sp.]|jgi:hypothetical protein|nr:hypothetical protein [Treponema sp.]